MFQVALNGAGTDVASISWSIKGRNVEQLRMRTVHVMESAVIIPFRTVFRVLTVGDVLLQKKGLEKLASRVESNIYRNPLVNIQKAMENGHRNSG